MRKGLFWLALVLIAGSCDSLKKNEKSAEELLPLAEVPPSFLSFQVNIPARELEKGLNRTLAKVLVDDALPLKDPSDTLFLKLIRKNEISIGVEKGVIQASLPLDVAVAVKKKVFGVTFSNRESPVMFSGTVKATAEIRLRDDWEMDIICTWRGLDWNDQPIVSLGGVSVDITETVERFLEDHVDVLSNALCTSIHSSISFREVLTGMWEKAQNPLRIRTRQQPLWMHSRPVGLAGQVHPKEDTLAIDLEYRTRLRITNQQVMSPPAQSLMARSSSLNKGSTFLAYPEIFIPYDLLEDHLTSELSGNELVYSGYSVAIKNVTVTPEGQLLLVSLTMEGDLSGNLEIRGRPRLQKDMRIILEEFEFEMKSDEEVMALTDLLLNSILEEYIESQLQWDAEPFLGRLDEIISQSIAKSPAGLKMALDLDFNRLETYQLTMTHAGIQWIFMIEGRSDVHLKNTIFSKVNR